MPKQSAGILLYRFTKNELEVFLIHPGGPFWAAKDDGAWSIPKGEFTEGESAIAAAKREFYEETGFVIDGNGIPLSPLKQKGGKMVFAFAVEGDCEAEKMQSNTFEIEWPPRSGKKKSFPEADRGQWFSLSEARIKISASQLPLLEEIAAKESSG